MAASSRTWLRSESDKRWKHMRKTLQTFQQDGILLDVELHANRGSSVKAHRTVLAAGSEYFRTLFSGPFKERNEAVVDLSRTFDSAQGLQEVVAYLYGDDIEIGENNLPQLLHSASVLLIPEITVACCHYMIDHITLANCLEFWLLSDTYCLEELEASFARFAKSRFCDTYSIWEETLAIPLDTMEQLFKCGFTELASKQDIEMFLDKYLADKEYPLNTRSNFTVACGIQEKQNAEFIENLASGNDQDMCEALLLNIEGGEAHLVYVTSKNKWFNLPNNYVKDKQHISEMCLGPDRNFYMVRVDTPLEQDRYELFQAWTGLKHDFIMGSIPVVEKELTSSFSERLNILCFTLLGDLFCLVQSNMDITVETQVEWVEIYIHRYNFRTFKWEYVDKLLSMETVYGDRELSCFVQTDVADAYICIGACGSSDQQELYLFKFSRTGHLLKCFPPYHITTNPQERKNIFSLLRTPVGKIGVGIRLMGKLCQFDIASESWEDISGPDEDAEEDAAMYDCTSLHLAGRSKQLHNLQYYEGHYEGFCSRFFVGQAGETLRELAPIPLVSCETIEEWPVSTFYIDATLLEVLEAASCLDQLEKPLLSESWAADEIKEECQDRLVHT